jgi:hypothetical protein
LFPDAGIVPIEFVKPAGGSLAAKDGFGLKSAVNEFLLQFLG